MKQNKKIISIIVVILAILAVLYVAGVFASPYFKIPWPKQQNNISGEWAIKVSLLDKDGNWVDVEPNKPLAFFYGTTQFTKIRYTAAVTVSQEIAGEYTQCTFLPNASSSPSDSVFWNFATTWQPTTTWKQDAGAAFTSETVPLGSLQNVAYSEIDMTQFNSKPNGQYSVVVTPVGWWSYYSVPAGAEGTVTPTGTIGFSFTKSGGTLSFAWGSSLSRS